MSPRGQSPTSGRTAGTQAFPEKMAGGGRGEGDAWSLQGRFDTPQPPPWPAPAPLHIRLLSSCGNLYLSSENKLAGSQLLGCRGQPIRLWGHLTYHQGPGLGALDLKDWRAGPPQGLCPERDRREETGSREQATEVVGTQACRLGGSGHPPVSWLHEGTLGQGSRPRPSHSAFSRFFHLPGSPPCPQGSWGIDSRTQTQTPLWQGWGQT